MPKASSNNDIRKVSSRSTPSTSTIRYIMNSERKVHSEPLISSPTGSVDEHTPGNSCTV